MLLHHVCPSPLITHYTVARITARSQSRTRGLQLVLAVPGGYRITASYRNIGEDCLCAVYKSGECLEDIFAEERQVEHERAAFDSANVGDRWDLAD